MGRECKEFTVNKGVSAILGVGLCLSECVEMCQPVVLATPSTMSPEPTLSPIYLISFTIHCFPTLFA